MKRKHRIRIAGGVFLVGALYVGAYCHFRYSGQITHHASSRGAHDVRSNRDPWAELAVDMAGSNRVLRTLAVVESPSPHLLNTVFWPLRHLESAIHRQRPSREDPAHVQSDSP